MNGCSVEGCDNPVRVKNTEHGPLCNPHYLRWTRKGRLGKQPKKPFYAERRAWANLNSRCKCSSTKSWHRYGGRGIKVTYTSFDEFLSDIGKRPGPGYSVDRIDNDGDYAPGNCRWATQSEQVSNSTLASIKTHNGKTQTLTQWAEQAGLKPNTLIYRLRRGWTLQMAIRTPVSERKGNGHPRAKLTDEIVRTIRSSSLPDCILAERYSVSRKAIWAIRNRETWRHVK